MTQAYYSWDLQPNKFNRFGTVTDAFTDLELKEIIRSGEAEMISAAAIVNSNNSVVTPEYRSTSISWIPSSKEENSWLFRKLTDYIVSINKQLFEFDLRTIENLQYSIYNEGDFYKEHDDITDTTSSVRKLSFSLQLVDQSEYDGGDLLLKVGLNTEEAEVFLNKIRVRGTLIFFPSFTSHEVLKVTRGTRKSLVGWVTGPKFKQEKNESFY